MDFAGLQHVLLLGPGLLMTSQIVEMHREDLGDVWAGPAIKSHAAPKGTPSSVGLPSRASPTPSPSKPLADSFDVPEEEGDPNTEADGRPSAHGDGIDRFIARIGEHDNDGPTVRRESAAAAIEPGCLMIAGVSIPKTIIVFLQRLHLDRGHLPKALSRDPPVTLTATLTANLVAATVSWTRT